MWLGGLRAAGAGRACVLGRTGLACWGAQGGRRTGAGGRELARASGSWAQAQAGGRALGARQGAGCAAGRWARGARTAWAPGLALGSALGSLGPFSISLDSFFFLSHQMNTVHYKIKLFQKKKKIIKFK